METAGQQYMYKKHHDFMESLLEVAGPNAVWWLDEKTWDGVNWPNRKIKNDGTMTKPSQIVIKTSASVVNEIIDWMQTGNRRSLLVGTPKQHDYVTIMFKFGKTTEMQGRGKNRKSVKVDQPPQIIKIESTGKTTDASGKAISAATMTAMQELGTLWIFKRVIQDNKNFNKWKDIKDDPDTWNELVKIWTLIGKVPEGPEDKWIEIFFKQNKVFMRNMADPRIKLLDEFNRGKNHANSSTYTIPGSSPGINGKTFMEFISDHVKQYGISQKDNWNPADIWLIKDEAKWRKIIVDQSSVEGTKSPTSMNFNLQRCNDILRQAWEQNEIIGISLKAIGQGDEARWQAVNTTQEFVSKRSDLNYKKKFVLEEIRCYLNIKDDGSVTQDSWVYIDNGNSKYKFQIKANSSSDKSGSGLKYEGQQEGATAARLGKATVSLVLSLMDEYGLSFDSNKTSYPITVDQLSSKQDEYKRKLRNLSNYGVNLSKSRPITPEQAYDNLLYLMHREPWVANSKCQQITWLDQLITLRGERLNIFLADLVFLSKKEGQRYGPFGKIY